MRARGTQIDWPHFNENVFGVFGKKETLAMIKCYQNGFLRAIKKIEQKPNLAMQSFHTMIGSSRSIGALGLASYIETLKVGLEKKASFVTREQIETLTAALLVSISVLSEECVEG